MSAHSKRLFVTILFLITVGSTYAQSVVFFELVKCQTPQKIQAAIEHGADVNARDLDGMTPLMAAAESNLDPVVVMMLLEAGADGRAKDNWGRTAFDYAQYNAFLKGSDAYQILQEASQ